MSQSTYKLNGAGGGLAVRLGAEAAFDAIASNNSGPNEPSEILPLQWWADTANGLMKQRNQANTAWTIIGPLDQPGFGLGDQVGDYKLSARLNIDKYLRCTFQEVSRATYAELFAAIGTQFGAGNGTTTFNLPGPQGRALVIAGPGAGLTNRNVGDRFGAETHQLTGEQNGYHGHGVHDPGHVHPMDYRFRGAFVSGARNQDGAEVSGVGSGPILPTHGAGTGIGIHPNGSGSPHNNIQPSIAIGHLWIRALP